MMEEKVGFIALLLIHAAMASTDPEVVCSSEPPEAAVGADVTLQCQLVPPLDETNVTVEWRYESHNRTTHLYQDGWTSLPHEELTKGNLSVKLSSVRLSDSGTYRCSITGENLQKSCFVNLTVVSAESSYTTEKTNDSSKKMNTPLIIGIIVAVVVVLIIIGVLCGNGTPVSAESSYMTEKTNDSISAESSYMTEKTNDSSHKIDMRLHIGIIVAVVVVLIVIAILCCHGTLGDLVECLVSSLCASLAALLEVD